MELDKWTWRKVFKYLDFYDKHRFIAICGFLNENVFVTDLFYMPPIIQKKISDEILQYYPYCRKLHAYNNPNIKDVSHLLLKILDASGRNCGITDKDLPLTLEKLNAYGNPKIKDVSHLPLKILDARGSCGITDPLPPTLEKLHASYNSKIKDVSHLPLKQLYADGSCGITDPLPPTLEILYAHENPRIKDVSHLPLKQLHANWDSGITDEDLPLTLEKLNAYGNPKIRDVSRLSNLKVFNREKIEIRNNI